MIAFDNNGDPLITGPPLRLLCDEMLERLGRFLRAAGYDTALAGRGQADRDVLRLAAAEDRVLITRDQRIAPPASVRVVHLSADSLDLNALELRSRLRIDWLDAPFSRCLVDNAVLDAASPAERARVPDKARALGGPVTACPACRRVYWPGSHVRRMGLRLARWRDGLPPGGTDAQLSLPLPG
jgi:uncharacterized protein with PIN domain